MTVLENVYEKTHEQLISDLSGAHREISRSQARFLECLGDFDERQVYRYCGAVSTAAWLARYFDMADNTAYEYVRVARLLKQYVYCADEYMAGRISYSQVRLLARYLTTDNELDLVELAVSLSYRELERALAGRDQPGSKDNDEENRLRIWTNKATGRLHISGNFDPLTGEKIKAALKVGELSMLIDASDIPDPHNTQDVDEKLEETATQPEPVETTRIRSASGYGVPAGKNLVPAFLGLVGIAHCQPMNRRRAPGTQVHVMFSEDGHAFLPGNPACPSRRLTGDILNAEMRGHLLDSAGRHLYYGRSRRLVSDGLAEAVLARWGFMCATPGCKHTQFMEFHHIEEWVTGGLTDPNNILPLCSHCHARVSDGVFSIGFAHNDTSTVVFRFRDGSEYHSHNRSLPVRVVPACAEEWVDELSFDDHARAWSAPGMDSSADNGSGDEGRNHGDFEGEG
ncbi:HNH endonuclease signature motif containing protein [Corynebacterium tapiri]|uniref:DUF222 domain-containing protein n=1 Tax=Corynebacterium tapiri TaxID=1448266 RepID=A0A5C4U4P8_9CORY|nr:HNH endonuclease signature motif containing protein [Corynebacterium tapiri]TNL97333.1 DUF222 domain-containing protein [Corynebacterium tapiri]